LCTQCELSSDLEIHITLTAVVVNLTFTTRFTSPSDVTVEVCSSGVVLFLGKQQYFTVCQIVKLLPAYFAGTE
jgi:ribosomal protein L31